MEYKNNIDVLGGRGNSIKEHREVKKWYHSIVYCCASFYFRVVAKYRKLILLAIVETLESKNVRLLKADGSEMILKEKRDKISQRLRDFKKPSGRRFVSPCPLLEEDVKLLIDKIDAQLSHSDFPTDDDQFREEISNRFIVKDGEEPVILPDIEMEGCETPPNPDMNNNSNENGIEIDDGGASTPHDNANKSLSPTTDFSQAFLDDLLSSKSSKSLSLENVGLENMDMDIPPPPSGGVVVIENMHEYLRPPEPFQTSTDLDPISDSNDSKEKDNLESEALAMDWNSLAGFSCLYSSACM